MPSYIYQCACGYRVEVLHGMLEEPLIECKHCLIVMERKPQVGGVSFVGSGWGKDV